MASAAAPPFTKVDFKNPDDIFKLLNNPFMPTTIAFNPRGAGYYNRDNAAYRMIDAGLHGKMPPADYNPPA